MRPAVRKSGEQKTARQGVRRARKAAGRRARLWAALSLRSVRRRGAWLCPTIRARSFAALVFSNSRQQNRGAARGFCRRARVQAGALFLPHRLWGKLRAKEAARQGVRRGAESDVGGWAAFLLFFLRANYAHIFALRTISAARGESAAAVGGALRFVHPFGGALAPLGSPPGRLPLSNYSGAEFCRACFFLTTARKTVARRGSFCRRARLYYHLRI